MKISDALAIAVEHHRAGRLDLADEIYRHILSIEPEHVDALHLLGVVAHQMGKNDIAVAHISRAIGLRGTDAGFHTNLGTVFKDQGKVEEAIACYRRALELKPDLAEAHYNLGIALKDRGRLLEAVACYRQVLELNPAYAEAHNNLGAALKDQGRLGEAVACYRRALELKADFAEAYNNLGVALRDQGNLAEAVTCYRRALELKPTFAEAHSNLGVAWKDRGKLDEAVASCRRALELNPRYADAHNNLGSALKDQGKLDEAVACYGLALQLKPAYAEAYSNLGSAFQEQGHLDEAVACYRQALKLKPDFFLAQSNLGVALKDQGNPEDAVACFRRARELNPNDAVVHSNLVYGLAFCPGYDAKAIHGECCRWNQQHAEPLAKSIQPHSNNHSPDRRLRVGYVSPYFRTHVVGFNLLPLLREHDRQRFEVFCYSDVLRPDGVTERLRRYADAWRETAGLTHVELAQRIREDQIDLLLDLTLHMARNRLLVFALKPAPVQATFAGYPGTTGLTTMDYRLTDPYLDPAGLDDRYYSEQSIRLPDCFWCYDPLDGQPAASALPAHEKKYVTFGCLNNFAKVNPPVLDLWARVLRAVDGSRLVILASEGAHRGHALALLAEQGVDRDRVRFVAAQPRPLYLRAYHGIDVGLDTFPYNGHTTSLDAFWMGVPVVTLRGSTVVGRAGACQLMNLGLPELIAASPEQYVQIAAHLAQDLSRLSGLRATLRGRMQASPLMDAPRFARNVEAAYRRMWRAWCAKWS